MRRASKVTLDVVQSSTEVELSMVKDGQKTVNRFPLKGKDGVYNNLRGPIGKCRGHLKEKNLTLDYYFTLYPNNPNLSMSVHVQEVWKLSTDQRTLTITGTENLVGAPSNIINEIPPWTEIYSRD